MNDQGKRIIMALLARLVSVEEERESLKDMNIFFKNQVCRLEERLDAMLASNCDPGAARLLDLLSSKDKYIESLELEVSQLRSTCAFVNHESTIRQSIPAPIVTRPSLSQRGSSQRQRNRESGERAQAPNRTLSKVDPLRASMKSSPMSQHNNIVDLKAAPSYRIRRSLAPSDVSNRPSKN